MHMKFTFTARCCLKSPGVSQTDIELPSQNCSTMSTWTGSPADARQTAIRTSPGHRVRQASALQPRHL